MAIAHRSVILECFACVGLVLTSIVDRFVWGAHALLLLQRKEGEPNICMSGTPTSREVASETFLGEISGNAGKSGQRNQSNEELAWYRYRD